MIAPLVCEKRERPASHANKPHVSKRKRKRKHSNSAPQQGSSEKTSLIEVRVSNFVT